MFEIILKMKVGDKITFFLFGGSETGEIVEINKDKTLQISHMGVIYPNVQTFKKLPKKRSDNPSNKSYVPPWYILKNKK